MNSGLAQTERFAAGQPLLITNAKLPHDDFRRAHDELRGAYFNRRRSHDDGVMMFVSGVLVASAFRENTSGGGEEGDDTDKKQDYFHVWFVSLSGGHYAMGVDFSMGCNPTYKMLPPSFDFGAARKDENIFGFLL